MRGAARRALPGQAANCRIASHCPSKQSSDERKAAEREATPGERQKSSTPSGRHAGTRQPGRTAAGHSPRRNRRIRTGRAAGHQRSSRCSISPRRSFCRSRWRSSSAPCCRRRQACSSAAAFPAPVAAVLIVTAVGAGVAFMVGLIASPVMEWSTRLPELGALLREKLHVFDRPLALWQELQSMLGGSDALASIPDAEIRMGAADASNSCRRPSPSSCCLSPR